MLGQLFRKLGLLMMAPLIVTACAVMPVGKAPAVTVAVRTAPVATGTIAGAVVFPVTSPPVTR